MPRAEKSIRNATDEGYTIDSRLLRPARVVVTS
jgi:molecular chaperone GrpE (heat shock protein)